jgi:hypothetical protein
MLFANIWNALSPISSGDARGTGEIVNLFYPAPANATTMNATIGNMVITWDVATMYTDQFLANATELQTAVLVFDIFGKVFQSYNIHLPSDFETLFDQVVHGEASPDQNTFTKLVFMLIDRFLVSAVYFLVACVCPEVFR